MYITTIILTKYCKNVLRNAQNKQEIIENMKNTKKPIEMQTNTTIKK